MMKMMTLMTKMMKAVIGSKFESKKVDLMMMMMMLMMMMLMMMLTMSLLIAIYRLRVKDVEHSYRPIIYTVALVVV